MDVQLSGTCHVTDELTVIAVAGLYMEPTLGLAVSNKNFF